MLINDICRILLGKAPEDFFGYTEGSSSRKSVPISDCRGLLGTCLSYVGVVEDHQRGTLHYHLLFFGGLDPFVLQQFAFFPSLCDAISNVLDKTYKASVPISYQLPALVKKVLRNHPELGMAESKIGDLFPAPLLDRGRLQAMCSGEEDRDRYINQQACISQIHNHTETCKTGFLGLTDPCVFFKKNVAHHFADLQVYIHPVQQQLRLSRRRGSR